MLEDFLVVSLDILPDISINTPGNAKLKDWRTVVLF